MSKAQHILVIGATGFTGARVLEALAQQSPQPKVTCLVREGTLPPHPPEGMMFTIARGTLDSADDLDTAMLGKDGLIYVASLGFGHAETVVAACEKAKLKKCVFTSTTALFTKLNASSKTVRIAAEKTITDSKLNWVIIRPTMIFGRKGDRNMERLVRFLKYIPVLFVPGGGKAMQQPVFVDDVAQALVKSYFSKNACKKAYNISGKTTLSFKEVVRITGKLLKKKVFVISLPLKPCRLLLRFYEKLTSKPYLKEEQLLRLNENKAFNHVDAAKDFGFTPHSFEDGMSNLITELKG